MAALYDSAEAFNVHHALVTHGSTLRVAVLNEQKVLPLSQVERMYSHHPKVRSIHTGKLQSLVSAWLGLESRKEFKTSGVYPPQAVCPPDCFNIWTPYLQLTVPEVTTQSLADIILTLPESVRLNNSFSTQEIANAVQDIGYVFAPRSTMNKKTSSYGLKHTLEHWRHNMRVQREVGGFYISNGSFIAAMLLCGYRFQKASGKNVYFNVKII